MTTNSQVPKVDVGILTIKDEEFEQVLSAMPDGIGHYEAPSHRHYTLRLADAGGGMHYSVAMARQLEQGNGDAQDLARDFIADLAPKLIMVVGIAGGIPNTAFTLGDVVLSTRILDYTLEARKDRGATDYAMTGGPIARSIEGAVANLRARAMELGNWTEGLPPRPAIDPKKLALYGPEQWRSRVRESIAKHFLHAPRCEPIFLSGAVGSSDRLIQDAHIVITWLQTARSLLAVEMESAGIYRAARDRCPMVAVRGISDIVGLARDEAWTRYACATAAAFAKAFLRTHPVPCSGGGRARRGAQHREKDDGRGIADLPNYLTTKLLANRPNCSLEGLRVLAVEDEELFHPHLKKLLQKCGAKLQLACNGAEALKLFTAPFPDLVLTDIVMPRLDGFGLAREIQKSNPTIPIVFMSGYPESLAKPQAKEYSCAFLERPIEFESLRACLQNAVADDFRLRAREIWPDHQDVVHLYNKCRKPILTILETYRSNELFETVLRYYVKDCVHACAKSAKAGEPGAPLLARLEKQITELQTVAAGVKFGSQSRFSNYLQAVLSDLAEEYPLLRIERRIDESADVLLDPKVQSLLTMATLELIDNRRDALAKYGAIRVSVRQRASVGTLLFKVGYDCGWSMADGSPRMAEDGVHARDDEPGIGLPLIQAMAERLGGQIRLVHQDGVEFVLEAPLRRGECPPSRCSLAK
jgi:CheY-like chemotaxis protein